jgi:survival of motor neuron protein-interacting protein 1
MIISSEENLGTEEGTEDPEDYTDDNDDYNSILRPAFEVDGEPDFSTGPPEDGLEYLRRVRYIISLFPSFCVFTLLNFWYYG